MPAEPISGKDLQDLAAQLLAADSSDSARLAIIQTRLSQSVSDFAPGSPIAELAKIVLVALRSAEGAPPSEAAATVNAAATAIGAAAMALNHPGEKALAEIARSATILRQILNRRVLQPVPARQPPALVDRVMATAAECPGPIVDADPELIQEFIDESCERIAAAEASLLALESDADNEDLLNIALGAFHTIKGASGFLGQANIQELAHRSEDLLIRGRQGQVRMTGEHADAALRACDMLRAMIQSLGTADASQQIEGLNNLLDLLSPADAAPIWTSPGGNAANPTENPGEDGLREAFPESSTKSAPSPLPTDIPHGAEGSVHVRTDRLDRLIETVGELMIAHSITAQDISLTHGTASRLGRSVAHTGKMVGQLQDLAMSLRMVPLKPTFQKMARLVRDLSRKSGKAVNFLTSGADTEIDRNMVEVATDPLVHMIRNAVDHGIEPADVRLRQGKAASGTVSLRACHSAGHVVIELSDDGKGLDREGILRKAGEAGLLGSGRELSDVEAFALIFHPGLSTAEQVTDISGRGIGMDVVKRHIELLHGKIEIRSTPGKGATFTLHLPLTMAIADAMLVRVGAERYLLPTAAIKRILRPESETVPTVVGRGEMVKFDGNLLPLFRLHRLFGVEAAKTTPAEALVVIIEGQGRLCGLLVDDLIAQQQVVIKSLGRGMPGMGGVAGGAILHDGTVGLILDADGLVQIAQNRRAAA